MKRLLLCITSVIMFTPCIVAQGEINLFEVEDSIAKPIVIKTDIGIFFIYGGERIAGHISRCVPEDAHVNRIAECHPYRVDRDSQNNRIVFWRFSRINRPESNGKKDSDQKESPEKRVSK